MDPNETLRRIRSLVDVTLKSGPDNVDSEDALDKLQKLAELTDALDGWISKGGFLPTAWQAKR